MPQIIFTIISSHSITADLSVAETAKAAEFFLADGVVLTGTATGSPANASELEGHFNSSKKCNKVK
jgi:predicted TIM-barrel enzyme